MNKLIIYIPKQLYFLKNKFIFLFWYLGLCPPRSVPGRSPPTVRVRPHFFCDRRECLWYCHIRSTPAAKGYIWRSPPLGVLKLIVYITCKIKLVLFSTNSILALSRSVSESIEDIGSFCGGKKNNKKFTNLKILSKK